MRYHYRITQINDEQMDIHPSVAPIEKEYKKRQAESRFFNMGGFELHYRNKLTTLLKTELPAISSIGNGLSEIAVEEQLTGEQLLRLAKYGVTLKEFSPKKEYAAKIKSDLADKLADCIKNGYDDLADTIYKLIKEL